MHALFVLMWKHGIVRLRKYFHTPFQFLFPILMFLLIFFLRNDLNPVPKSHTPVVRYVEEPVPLSSMDVPRRIVYTPNSEMANKLMDLVGTDLGIKRLPNLDQARVWGYYGTADEEEIQTKFFANMKHDEALIIFHNLDLDIKQLPNNLNYTIRMKQDFQTSFIEPFEDSVTAHHNYGRSYVTFMRLQGAVDTNYLEMLTGQPINQTIYLQEMPFASPNTSRQTALELIYKVAMPIICFLSLIMPFSSLMSNVLDERTTGIQELLKLAGVSSPTIQLAHFLNSLPIGVVFATVGTVVMKIGPNPLVPVTSGAYVFVMLILYYISTVTPAFPLAYAIGKSNHPDTMSYLAYFVLHLPWSYLGGQTRARAAIYASGLLPHVPMSWFFYDLAKADAQGQPLTLTTRSLTCGSVLEAYIFMVLQVIIYLILAWYFENIRAGTYGVAKPWNFCLLKQYWSKKQVCPTNIEEDEETLDQRDPAYFEPISEDAPRGIQINNVSKVFKSPLGASTTVLQNVSADIIKGEITILLGQNGAGKTTLMNIITGLLPASAGEVYLNGMHYLNQRSQINKQVGMCPQHNLFFTDLNVKEHVMMFTMLRGQTYREARKSSKALIEKLGLSSKCKSMNKELSGGMKRRLQLACALAGGADILILDEPTSGLDVETRRELWDLILSLRGSRTVLLTTHFMEEADALGDRLVALCDGRVRGHATPMHLKKAIGSGYRLSVLTVDTPKEAQISALITSHVPEAILNDRSMNSLTYNLPSKYNSKFPSLFNELESQRFQLGVKNMGVGITTLEEVFFTLCRTGEPTSTDEVDSTLQDRVFPVIPRPFLWCRQACALFKRQIQFLIAVSLRSWIINIAVVLLAVSMTALMTNNSSKDLTRTSEQAASPSGPVMSVELYSGLAEDGRPKVLLDVNTTKPLQLNVLRTSFPAVSFVSSTDVVAASLEDQEKDLDNYKRNLIGVQMNDTVATALYSTAVRHTAPVAVNTLTNLMAIAMTGEANHLITTVNQPVEGTFKPLKEQPKSPKDAFNITWLSVIIVFVICVRMTECVSLPIQERQTGVRHILIMAGVPASLFWFVTFISDLFIVILPVVGSTAILVYFIDTDSTLNTASYITMMVIILVVGSSAFLAFLYLCTFIFEHKSVVTLISMTTAFIAIITFVIELTMDEKRALAILCTIASYVLPPHQMFAAMQCAGTVAYNVAMCQLNQHLGPKFVQECMSSPELSVNMFASGKSLPGTHVLVLLAHFVVFMVLVILCQEGIFNAVWDRVWNHHLKPYTPTEEDVSEPAVLAEMEYVDKAIQSPDENDVMLAHDLHKRYYSLGQGGFKAVHGLNFSVKKGECFGILGVNGAGKSTTFKMLIGEERPTRGQVYSDGFYLHKDKHQYLRTVGYCPQWGGVDPFLSGRAFLRLLLTARGLTRSDVTQQTDAWISLVGLTAWSSRRISSYSGGCARRLSAAAALSVRAPLALLDEPTAGVDAAARRVVHRAVRAALGQGRAVVITSHSMDEMESLCSRIAIVCGGAARAQGGASELRARHARGHALHVKLTTPHGQPFETQLSQLKTNLIAEFNCTLKDEHMTMLHYHITDKLSYSELFTKLENIRKTYSIIEDYAVAGTTLEEVFLTLAKEYQHDRAPQSRRSGLAEESV